MLTKIKVKSVTQTEIFKSKHSNTIESKNKLTWFLCDEEKLGKY